MQCHFWIGPLRQIGDCCKLWCLLVIYQVIAVPLRKYSIKRGNITEKTNSYCIMGKKITRICRCVSFHYHRQYCYHILLWVTRWVSWIRHIKLVSFNIWTYLCRFCLFVFFFFSSAQSLSDTFLGDYWMEINETSQEC
jgi:Ca2+/Na+ antiporter